ncbi:MAG TPA: hypothetical protein VI731_03410 [Bacteroidia bacterium]|nr:hypothetical protein [Bacteroidia bacterium]
MIQRVSFIFLIACFLFPGKVVSQDTLIRTGTVHLSKPQIQPYVLVAYRLELARVKQAEVLIPVKYEDVPAVERDLQPVYDSVFYPATFERVFPQKEVHFSRFFSENLVYTYSASDTPRVDTMRVGLWITPNGKIKFVAPDTTGDYTILVALEKELAYISERMRNAAYGRGGGYNTPGKLFRPSEFHKESYYCELFVIVSSTPLTIEQKNTGSHWAAFDMPLNSPPDDSQHAEFVKRNKAASKK